MTNIHEASRPVLGRLVSLPPEDRIEAANLVLDDLRAVMAEVSASRRTAVRELRSQGYTLREIAEMIGTTAQRIHQIESGYGRREQAARKKP